MHSATARTQLITNVWQRHCVDIHSCVPLPTVDYEGESSLPPTTPSQQTTTFSMTIEEEEVPMGSKIEQVTTETAVTLPPETKALPTTAAHPPPLPTTTQKQDTGIYVYTVCMHATVSIVCSVYNLFVHTIAM